MGKAGVDGVGGDITSSLRVTRVADLERVGNVQDRICTARAEDSGGEIEGVAVGIVLARDGTLECRACSSLIIHSQ